MKKTKIPDSVICDTLRSAIEKNTPDVLDSVIADIDKSAVCEEVNLTETDRSIGEIATAVGIPDVFYFARLFRETTGETATDYRRKRR